MENLECDDPTDIVNANVVDSTNKSELLELWYTIFHNKNLQKSLDATDRDDDYNVTSKISSNKLNFNLVL